MKNYYEILEVEQTATRDDIAKAFRKLAAKYHPDRNPGNKEAEAKFVLLSEAYTVLSDPEKRRAYDARGTSVPVGGVDIEEIFKHVFSEDGPFAHFFKSATSKKQSKNKPKCETCKGTGKITKRVGFFEASITCIRCLGQGTG